MDGRGSRTFEYDICDWFPFGNAESLLATIHQKHFHLTSVLWINDARDNIHVILEGGVSYGTIRSYRPREIDVNMLKGTL